MEQITITLVGKSKSEASDYQKIFSLIAAHISVSDAQKLREKLEQNPQLLKTAIKYL